MFSLPKTVAPKAFVWAALTAALSVPAVAAPVETPKPKLVVVISIDQFSASLFEQHRADFHGGLGRLARQGTVYPSGYQSHGMTETCPGHSTLLTGKYPNKTGIVANDFYDLATGQKTYCLADPSVTLANDPSGGGRLVSPKLLMAETYGDWLKAVSPGSRVYAVSGKDRGAINMAGHKADGVFWLETRFGMTTWVEPGQDAKARLAPMAAFNARLIADQKKKPFTWTYADKRCAALEGDYVTGGRAWRAALPRPTPTDEAGVTNDLSISPYTDRVTLEAAQVLRDEFKLGDGEATDVLTISLSATDFIGHRYGTQGPEMCDHLLRLDDRLGAFLDSLDKVKGQVLVVLAADHGGSDFPERLAQQGYEAGRVPPTQWLKDLNAALREQLRPTTRWSRQAGSSPCTWSGPTEGRRRSATTPGSPPRPWRSWPSGRKCSRPTTPTPCSPPSRRPRARRRTRSASPSACAAAPIPAGWATSWWPSSPTGPRARRALVTWLATAARGTTTAGCRSCSGGRAARRGSGSCRSRRSTSRRRSRR